MTVTPRVVALASIALTLAVVYGLWYAFSVVLVALLNEFGWSRSTLAGAFSVFMLMHGGLSPVVGALCARARPSRVMAAGGVALSIALLGVSLVAQPWQLYLSFGVVTAAAVASCGWVPSLVHVQRSFPDRLGLAMGIASAGVGVGIFVVVPAFQALIDAFGWRAAFRAFALICLLWIVPSSLLLLREPARGAATRARDTTAATAPPADPAHSASLAQAMRLGALWLLVAIYFLGNFASQTLHVHHVAYLVDHGLPAMTAATIVGIVGASSIVGKIGGGWLSDRIDREFIYVAGIGCVVLGIGLLGLVRWLPSLWVPYGYAVLFGAGYSVTASLAPAMVSDRFGGRNFGAIVGLSMVGGAIGSALGAWLAGFLFDLSGSYAIPFTIAGACAAAAGAAAWHARTLRRRALRAASPPT